MSSLPPQQLFTTAILSLLTTGLAPVAVGDHRAPADITTFYAMLHQLPAGGQGVGPPLTAPDADLNLAFQVTSVGRRRDQAQWLADKARTLLLGRDTGGAFLTVFPAVPGWGVASRIGFSAASGVLVAGTDPNRFYSIPDRYILLVTPA